jgi:hypothetical protein
MREYRREVGERCEGSWLLSPSGNGVVRNENSVILYYRDVVGGLLVSCHLSYERQSKKVPGNVV